jgi:hypothetical protein
LLSPWHCLDAQCSKVQRPQVSDIDEDNRNVYPPYYRLCHRNARSNDVDSDPPPIGMCGNDWSRRNSGCRTAHCSSLQRAQSSRRRAVGLERPSVSPRHNIAIRRPARPVEHVQRPRAALPISAMNSRCFIQLPNGELRQCVILPYRLTLYEAVRQTDPGIRVSSRPAVHAERERDAQSPAPQINVHLSDGWGIQYR